MNFAYHVYIAIGNLLWWPFTVLFMLFSNLLRFLAFATGAIISGIIGTFALSPEIILAFGPYFYFISGGFFALSVIINTFSTERLPEYFNIFYCLLTGVFVGLLIGILV